MKKHFVTFFSPGTFVAESTCLEISQWDVSMAIELARGIREKHGSVPYGFRFTTRTRSEDEFDSKETAKSNMYFLGGCVETYEEIVERNDPKEEILRQDMKANDIKRIIINTNSYKSTQPFGDNDVLLEVDIRQTKALQE